MNHYRISGTAGTSRWIEAELAMDVRAELTRRYNNLAESKGLPRILHGPGAVCGDCFDPSTGSVHGARNGHGIVSIERQKP